MEPVEVVKGSELSTLFKQETYYSIPERSGYKFIGWYKDAAFTELCNKDYDTVTEDMVLYAAYEEASSLPNSFLSIVIRLWDEAMENILSEDTGVSYISSDGDSYSVDAPQFYRVYAGRSSYILYSLVGAVNKIFLLTDAVDNKYYIDYTRVNTPTYYTVSF